MANNLNYMPQPMNVPTASVDQNFMVPNMGQPQVSPEGQQVNDVLRQYIESKTQQKSGNGITEAILANRFQPTMQDRTASISQTNAAFGAPDLFKPVSPDQAMAQRYANELSPYTSMLEAQGKIGSNMMNMSGGATGVLINRLMNENPGMNFQQALQQVQTGLRSNTMIDAQGNVVPMQGALGTIAGLSNAKQTGQNVSDLQYKPKIAGGEAAARTGIELANAAGIEQQKKIGAGEITEVQKKQGGQQGLASTVDSMMQNYQKLQQMKGTVSTSNTMGQNLGAYAKNTTLGQGVQKLIGTEEQSVRNEINMSIPALINDIRSSTGMSAKAMDSNTELQFYLQMATNPQVDVQANMHALNVIKKKYLSPTPGMPQAPQPVGNSGATHVWNPATQSLEDAP